MTARQLSMQPIGSSSVERFADHALAGPRRIAAEPRLTAQRTVTNKRHHVAALVETAEVLCRHPIQHRCSARENLVGNPTRLIAIAGVMALVGACSSPPPPPPAPMVAAPPPPPVTEQPYTVPPAPPPMHHHYAHRRYHHRYVHHVHHVYHHHVHHVVHTAPPGGAPAAPPPSSAAPMAPAPAPMAPGGGTGH